MVNRIKITVGEIRKGEIYTSIDNNEYFIWRAKYNSTLHYESRIVRKKFEKDATHSWNKIYQSSEFEKFWLESCEAKGKYISEESINKTFDKINKTYEIY